MAANGVRFVRIGGRVVPIKGGAREKKRGVGERASGGFHTGAKIGAAVGGVNGFINTGGNFFGGGVGALVGGGIGGVIGAGIGALAGSRTKMVPAKRRK